MLLTRYACIGNICGGFSKLLKHSIPILKAENVREIISFSDNRISNGRVYSTHNFINSRELKYDYYWVLQNRKYHKFGFRRDILKKKFPMDFKAEETEEENCIRLGFHKIYDAGKIRWVLPI
jgi:hypothetical protein